MIVIKIASHPHREVRFGSSGLRTICHSFLVHFIAFFPSLLLAVVRFDLVCNQNMFIYVGHSKRLANEKKWKYFAVAIWQLYPLSNWFVFRTEKHNCEHIVSMNHETLSWILTFSSRRISIYIAIFYIEFNLAMHALKLHRAIFKRIWKYRIQRFQISLMKGRKATFFFEKKTKLIQTKTASAIRLFDERNENQFGGCTSNNSPHWILIGFSLSVQCT